MIVKEVPIRILILVLATSLVVVAGCGGNGGEGQGGEGPQEGIAVGGDEASTEEGIAVGGDEASTEEGIAVGGDEASTEEGIAVGGDEASTEGGLDDDQRRIAACMRNVPDLTLPEGYVDLDTASLELAADVEASGGEIVVLNQGETYYDEGLPRIEAYFYTSEESAAEGASQLEAADEGFTRLTGTEPEPGTFVQRGKTLLYFSESGEPETTSTDDDIPFVVDDSRILECLQGVLG